MPPGSKIYMSEKSAYVNANIFLRWLKDQFVPRKPLGKTLLILDGHASHCNSIEMLEYAEQNDIILLCLPSHTTHYLQPLDRAFFKSLKSHYNNACRLYMKTHPSQKISRLNFGQLLNDSWTKAATVNNAVSSFRSTEIVPFNPQIIPDYAFLNSDNEQTVNIVQTGTTSDLPENREQCVTPEPQPGTSGSASGNNLTSVIWRINQNKSIHF